MAYHIGCIDPANCPHQDNTRSILPDDIGQFCRYCGKEIEVKEGREWLIKEREKWLKEFGDE